MATISPINSAYRQNLAFGTKSADTENTEIQKPKRHPVKAVLLYGLPGAGEMTNGDTKKGLLHLGVAIALAIPANVLYFKKFIPSIIKNTLESGKVFLEKGMIQAQKTLYKDVSKKSLIGMAVLVALGIANATHAAIGTYKGKEST